MDDQEIAGRIDELTRLELRSDWDQFSLFELTNVLIGDLLDAQCARGDEVLHEMLTGKHGGDVQGKSWAAAQAGLYGAGKEGFRVKSRTYESLAFVCLSNGRMRVLADIVARGIPEEHRPVRSFNTGATTPEGVLLDRFSGWTDLEVPQQHRTFARQLHNSGTVLGFGYPPVVDGMRLLAELDPNHADVVAGTYPEVTATVNFILMANGISMVDAPQAAPNVRQRRIGL